MVKGKCQCRCRSGPCKKCVCKKIYKTTCTNCASPNCENKPPCCNCTQGPCQLCTCAPEGKVCINCTTPGCTNREPGIQINDNPGNVEERFGFEHEGYHIVHINARSLNKRLPDLKKLLEKEPVSTLSISETFLKKKHADPYIPGYQKPYRKDRPEEVKQGGVALYVREEYNSKIVPEISVKGMESIWVKVTFPHQEVLIGTIYRQPKLSKTNFFPWFEIELERARNNCDNVVVLGDFNIDITHVSKRHRIHRIPRENNYKQLVRDITRPENRTVIDLIFVSDEDKVRETRVPRIPISDHYPVGITWEKQ